MGGRSFLEILANFSRLLNKVVVINNQDEYLRGGFLTRSLHKPLPAAEYSNLQQAGDPHAKPPPTPNELGGRLESCMMGGR